MQYSMVSHEILGKLGFLYVPGGFQPPLNGGGNSSHCTPPPQAAGKEV